MINTYALKDQRPRAHGAQSHSLTQAFGQQIANEFIVVSHVKDAVDTGSHQLLLGVSEVTRHVLRHEDDAAFPVDDEEEAIQGLIGQRQEQKDPVRPHVLSRA